MASAFSYYKDAYIALETFDRADINDIAIESLNSDMRSIAEDLNPKLMDASGRYNAAINSKDYDGALKALTEIESIAKTWKSRLNALPAESLSKTIIRTTVKIAAVLVSCYVITHSRLLQGLVRKWIIERGGKEVVAGIAAFGVDLVAQTKSFSTIFGEIANFMIKRTALKGGDKSQYKDDPNRHNGTYIAAQVGLDTWLKNVETAKNEIRKIQAEEKAK